MIRPLCCLLVIAAMLTPLRAEAQEQEQQVFDAKALPDPELARARGGFTLPGGIEVALAATITTDVNGARLLQTIFQAGAAGASATTQTSDATVTKLDPRGGSITAALPGLSVEHIVGQRLGTIIANTGDNRVIDNQLSISLSLGNVQPLSIGSAESRIQSLGFDSAIMRATGG